MELAKGTLARSRDDDLMLFCLNDGEFGCTCLWLLWRRSGRGSHSFLLLKKMESVVAIPLKKYGGGRFKV